VCVRSLPPDLWATGPESVGSLVNPSGWEMVESVGIVCPSCVHTFEIRRDSVEALLTVDDDQQSSDVSVSVEG
jgi:hypothetical protein